MRFISHIEGKGGMGYVGQNKSIKFWLSIMEWNKKMRRKDILITCTDRATGFLQMIKDLSILGIHLEVHHPSYLQYKRISILQKGASLC